MNIVAGLAGLKAAADLTKAVRDAAKAGTLKPDEFAGRVGEIYDYIIDSKDALVDAKDEIQRLQDQIRIFNDDKEFRASLTYQSGVYKRTGPHGEEVYCSACFDETGKRIRISMNEGQFNCPVKHGYIT